MASCRSVCICRKLTKSWSKQAMATYPGLVGDGLTQLSAYQLLQPHSSEPSPCPPYVRYPTLVSPYQISQESTKTTNSLPYPTTTHPLSSTKLNMLTTPHSIPDIQSLLPSPQYQLPIFYHPVSATMPHRVMTMPGMSTMTNMSSISTMSTMTMWGTEVGGQTTYV